MEPGRRPRRLANGKRVNRRINQGARLHGGAPPVSGWPRRPGRLPGAAPHPAKRERRLAGAAFERPDETAGVAEPDALRDGQTGGGRPKLIISEGEPTNGPVMNIGNTRTPVRFRRHPDDCMTARFAEAPTRHCAMSVGHNGSLFRKAAGLMNLKHAAI